MAKEQHFSPESFKFLKQLSRNNNRDWFSANKPRYESAVRDPFLRFIADFAPMLHSISPHLVADPRPSGGSLFRIYRDIRFSKDKSPYKTHAAAHFSHGDTETDAPGFYLHVEPSGCFGAAGLWHPDARTLTRVRTAITERPDDWKLVRRKVTIGGDALTRPPKGFDPGHPFIEDLKRKDFVTSVEFSEEQVCSSKFLVDYFSACKKMSPLVAFLSDALGLEW